MYKNQDVNINVLGAGKKNFDGAMQYVQSLKSPQHVVVGVGSNDIATKSPKSIVTQIENLVVCAQKKQCSVHILSLLEKMDQEDDNERVRNVNDKLSETFKDRENVYFSHFRRNYHAGNRNGVYSQNGPQNHWNNGPQNLGPRYNAQGDYITNKQKQLSIVFNQLLKMIQ